jgi:hypothetical protein
MGRWSYLDTDEERLPEGMTRVGYDADTQTYTFRDTRNNSLWEGAPGCEYGRMHRVSRGNTTSYTTSTSSSSSRTPRSPAARRVSDDEPPPAYSLHNKPLPVPPLEGGIPDFYTYSDEDKDKDEEEVAVPEGEERRFKRMRDRQKRQSQGAGSGGGLKRSGTLSRLARYIRGGGDTPPGDEAGTGTIQVGKVRNSGVGGGIRGLGRTQTVRGTSSTRTPSGRVLPEIQTRIGSTMTQQQQGQQPRTASGRPRRATTFDEIFASW